MQRCSTCGSSLWSARSFAITTQTLDMACPSDAVTDRADRNELVLFWGCSPAHLLRGATLKSFCPLGIRDQAHLLLHGRHSRGRTPSKKNQGILLPWFLASLDGEVTLEWISRTATCAASNYPERQQEFLRQWRHRRQAHRPQAHRCRLAGPAPLQPQPRCRQRWPRHHRLPGSG